MHRFDPTVRKHRGLKSCPFGEHKLRRIVVGERGSPIECRTDWPVGQQADKSRFVGPSVRVTEPAWNAILFGAAVPLSRGGGQCTRKDIARTSRETRSSVVC